MSNSRHLPIALALLPLALVVASACSSSSVGGVAPEDAKPSDAAPDAITQDAADAAPDAPPAKDATPDARPAGECASETTQTKCVTCCSNKHEEGSAVYFGAYLECICVTDNCQTPCENTLCNADTPKAADSTCNTCLMAKTSKCTPSIKVTCQANADCVAFDSCIGNSDCAGKTD